MNKYRPQNPMAPVRQQLKSALLYSALCLVICIVGFGFAEGFEAAKAAFIGGAIILVPSGWLAHRVASTQGAQYATAVALVKFSLCGLGFALLFVLKPSIHAFAVFIGAATVLLALPIATGMAQRLNSNESRH
ncbi:MAG: ATP synthase subunit I [Luminiphilus sp.]|nr:ATP synthase subunit I [Luminiphilus sp.]MDG1460085.1 ATP synthase subunit I [Luminiphilus sp.]